MKQVTLNIADNKFNTFLKFIETLDYVKVENVDAKALDELQNSLNEISQIKKGSLSKQSAKSFLNEL